MKNCILIHGRPDKEEFFDTSVPSLSNAHWFPWIQKKLMVEGILTQTPEIPVPYEPQYILWKNVLDMYPLDESYSLVGHSCGGGFLLRYLSERTVHIDKLVLVAPWLDPVKHKTGEFFQFNHDTKLLSRMTSAHLLYSIDDSSSGIKESVEIIRGWYPYIKYMEFANKGHFTTKDMHTQEFPELLEVLLQKT